MFANRQELCARVALLIENERGAKGLQPADIEAIVNSTVVRISRLLPCRTTGTLSGDGTSKLALEDISPSHPLKEWNAGSSRVLWVEYPLEQTPPARLLDGDFSLWPDPETATHIHFLEDVPAAAADNVLLGFTTLHEVDDDDSTFDRVQQPGVEWACAGDALAEYAARYVHETQRGEFGDQVTDGNKVDRCLALAKVYLEKASDALGIDLSDATPGPAVSAGPMSAWANVNPPNAYGGNLFTNRRRR